MNWKKLKDETPVLNTPCLFRKEGQIYYGWRRAVDGKYEIHGYYTNVAIEYEPDIEWIYIFDKVFHE